jgi:hypothetical protein
LECLRKDWSILSGIAPNSEVEIGKMVYYQQKCTKFRSDSGIIGLFFAEMFISLLESITIYTKFKTFSKIGLFLVVLHQIQKWRSKKWSITYRNDQILE